MNDYFGEHLDKRAKDAQTKYEGAFAREVGAFAEDEDFTELDDCVEVRQFMESQTRSRRRASGVWS